MTQTIGGSAIHWSGRFLISYIFGLVIIHLFPFIYSYHWTIVLAYSDIPVSLTQLSLIFRLTFSRVIVFIYGSYSFALLSLFIAYFPFSH